MSVIPGRVIIYGSTGALGQACTKFFRNKDWWVCTVSHKQDEQASHSVLVDSTKALTAQHENVVEAISSSLATEKVDAVICVAGGWVGGNAASKDFIKNCEISMKQSIETSCITAALAAKFLKDDGICAMVGSSAALDATPGMIAYGMAKAAVHHLVRSLGKPKSGLPEHSCAIGLLPATLDTPMNRKWMPKADTTTWTPLEYIPEIVYKWLQEPTTRPVSGSLLSLVTKNGNTTTENC